MMAKHTAGPWKAIQTKEFSWEIRSLVRGYRRKVARLCMTADDAPNARLIATAPDLLNLCKVTESYFGACGPLNLPLRAKLQAIIIKAEGRTP